MVILPIHEALANPQRTGPDLTRGWYAYDNLHIEDAGAQRYADQGVAYLLPYVSAHAPRPGDGTPARPVIRPGTPSRPGLYESDAVYGWRRQQLGDVAAAMGRPDLGAWSQQVTPWLAQPRLLPRRVVWAATGLTESPGYGTRPDLKTATALVDLARTSGNPHPLGGAPGAAAPTLGPNGLVFGPGKAQKIDAGEVGNLLFGRDHISVTVAVTVPPNAGGTVNKPGGGVIIGRSFGPGTSWMIYVAGGNADALTLVAGGEVSPVASISDNTPHILTLTAQAGANKAVYYLDGKKVVEINIGADRTELPYLIGARWADANMTAVARELTGTVHFAAIGAAYLDPEEVTAYHATVKALLGP